MYVQDGRPHDLSAALIDGGVAFTYLDTSIRETEVRLYASTAIRTLLISH